MLDVLFNPDGFFREKSEDPSLVPALVILVVVGLVGVVGSLPSIQATTEALPPEAQSFAGITYVFAAVGGLVGTFVRWLLYAGAFHVVSAVLYDAEEGSLGDMLALTGWGFIPAIGAAIVSSIASYIVFSSVTFPSDPQAIAQFAQQLQNRPEFLVASLLGILFLLWQGLLWTFAVKHGRGLELREAAITVAIPVAIAVLWRLFGLLGGFGGLM